MPALVSEVDNDALEAPCARGRQPDPNATPAVPVEFAAHEAAVLAPRDELCDRALPELQPILQLGEAGTRLSVSRGSNHQQELVDPRREPGFARRELRAAGEGAKSLAERCRLVVVTASRRGLFFRHAANFVLRTSSYYDE